MEKKMSNNIKYVIRKKIFEYQGDYYSLTDYQIGEIVSVYSNLIDAQHAFQKLNIEYLQENTLSNYNVYDIFNETELQAINQVMIQRTNIGFLDESSYMVDVLPEEFNDVDTFFFAEQLKLLAYQLEEFNDENYVIWNIEKEHYLRLPDPYGNPFDQDDDFCGELIFGKTADFLKHHAEKKRFLEQFNNEFRLYQYGELSELSEQPEQLEQTLQKYSDTWKYENSRLELQRYVQPNFDTFEAVHSLLKTPLYEIRKVDFATLKDLIDLEETREVR